MMLDRELLQQALDELLHLSDGLDAVEIIKALQTRLAQPEPEPIKLEMWKNAAYSAMDLLIAQQATPKKEWVGLTDEEIWEMSQYNCGTRGEFARAIEAKLKEKNA
jgi:hypothetical protein